MVGGPRLHQCVSGAWEAAQVDVVVMVDVAARIDGAEEAVAVDGTECAEETRPKAELRQ